MEVENPDVFKIDVNKLTALLNKTVKIKLKNVLPELIGRIYTVDPVSENIVLIKDNDGSLSVLIVFNHAVEEMTILEGVQDIFTESQIINLFSNQQYITQSSLEKKHFLDWLVNSKIPFTQVDDIIDIEGVVIHPPYTAENCVSSNLIKLSRIQNLLQSIPVMST